MKGLFRLGLTVAALPASAAAAFAQCAMCKEALESGSGGGSPFSKGIAWSIFLLLGMFFALTGGFVFLIVRHGRTRPAG